METKKAIVLLSGGMDSAVALWWARSKGWKCQALLFDYGQRHRKELISARRLVKLAGVPCRRVTFRLPWGGSSLINKKLSLPQRDLKRVPKKIPSTYVPGRNTLFLSFALSWADQIGAEIIVIGANAIDYSGYPDCRPGYFKAFQKVAVLGTRMGVESKKRIVILAPLIKMTKAEIIRFGIEQKVPLDLTWSCYRGGKKPCGKCDSCQLRTKGFREARIL